jgi:hypothetical protein
LIRALPAVLLLGGCALVDALSGKNDGSAPDGPLIIPIADAGEHVPDADTTGPPADAPPRIDAAMPTVHLAFYPETLEFGRRIPGSEPAMDVYVRNIGNSDSAPLLRAVIDPITNPGIFTVVDDGCLGKILAPAPGDDCRLVIAYHAPPSGIDSAHLTVTTGTESMSVTLRGIATPVTSGLSLDPPTVVFPSVAVGQEVSMPLLVKNDLGMPLQQIFADLSGTGVEAIDRNFDIDASQCLAILQPNTSCTITVFFFPQTAIRWIAAIEVTAQTLGSGVLLRALGGIEGTGVVGP